VLPDERLPPGIEVHGTGSDILFELDSSAERDRLAASVT
jgi:hypothetical protein